MSYLIVIYLCLFCYVVFSLYFIYTQRKKIKIYKDNFQDKSFINNIDSDTLKMDAINELLENITHQWIKPLLIINDIVRMPDLKNIVNKKEIDNIKSRCEILNTNIKYLSSISGNFHFEKKPYFYKMVLYLDDVLDTSIKLVNPLIKNNNILILKDIETDITILSNKYILVEVVLNILNNAVEQLELVEANSKYIFIKIEKENNKIILSITDTAGGINHEVINRIFEPYFTTKKNLQNKGLGLYITHQLLAKIDAKITVTNDIVIHRTLYYMGAKFSIELPY